MTKLVVSLPHGEHPPGIRRDRFLVERLLWASWWVVSNLDWFEEFIEVVRVWFKHDAPNGDPSIVSNIVFEAVIVDPGTREKERKVMLCAVPETLRRKDGVEIIGGCLLDAIRADFAHRVKRMREEASRLTATLDRLQRILEENRAKISS